MKSKFPKVIRKMLLRSYLNGSDSKTAARKINESKLAKKHGLNYGYRQIATLFGNLERGRCQNWY